MRELINLNHIFEQMRQQSLANLMAGPRIFITGNKESGKTTTCKILVNLALKLGWHPILVDLNLVKNQISAPGCIAAALIEEPLEGHTDNLTSNAINYFHGSCNPQQLFITPQLFNTQVSELSEACFQKVKNDIQKFKSEQMLDQSAQNLINGTSEEGGNPKSPSHSAEKEGESEESRLVGPVFPQMFGSGMVIDGFSPDSSNDAQKNDIFKSLVQAIKRFRSNIVIVLDERILENDIRSELQRDAAYFEHVRPLIIPLKRSAGVKVIQSDMQHLFKEYFRGKNYRFIDQKDRIIQRVADIKANVDAHAEQAWKYGTNVFISQSENVQPHLANMQRQQNQLPKFDAKTLELSLFKHINKFMVQEMKIPLKDLKIFEIKYNMKRLCDLPANAVGPSLKTEFEQVNSYTLEQLNKFKGRIAGVMRPKDMALIERIEN
mmetsp:Transcript_9800/g.16504  ORF Transcript_9800/g.16504 Transcript_9800/m.16504 type:complete len:435 (+) Transcript_9800:264-1568(+)